MFDKIFRNKNRLKEPYFSYEDELNSVEDEIRELDKTIKFYEAKRKVLEDWKRFVKVSVKMDEGEVVCRNCIFYSSDVKGFCVKFESNVEGDANCPDFRWDV